MLCFRQPLLISQPNGRLFRTTVSNLIGRRRIRRASGLCITCGHRPSVEGGTKCETCRMTRRASERAIYASRRSFQARLRCDQVAAMRTPDRPAIDQPRREFCGGSIPAPRRPAPSPSYVPVARIRIAVAPTVGTDRPRSATHLGEGESGRERGGGRCPEEGCRRRSPSPTPRRRHP